VPAGAQRAADLQNPQRIHTARQSPAGALKQKKQKPDGARAMPTQTKPETRALRFPCDTIWPDSARAAGYHALDVSGTGASAAVDSRCSH
jgi:hypothetical protein